MCFTHSFFHFATLRKSLQNKPRNRRLTVCMVTDFVILSTTSKLCFELTSSVLSITSKQCFEQPAANFLVCSLTFIETLIFIEYKMYSALKLK
ncbi:S1 RNA-binding domain-containing protein [Streptococcus pneumoniae]|nr:S1 RNA-binding domain-containing protein [Streptococcus pneumoniae]